MPTAQQRLETLQVCKLLQCVREKDKYQIQKLVENGIPQLINYNEPTEGNTALNLASVANDDEMIEYLLDLGAHPDIVDFKGRTAIMRAAEYGHVQSMEILAKNGSDMTVKDISGKGVLFYCLETSSQRHTSCLEIALSHGADVNNTTEKGKPVFVHACERAKEMEEICARLLESGASPDSSDPSTGRTALMEACASGSEKVVEAILRANCKVIDSIDKNGSHAAHDTARSQNLKILFLLAAYGAKFDQYDDKGNNPTHYAALGFAMGCKFLSQRGCNPKPKNKDGFTPRVIAKDNGFKDCAKELRKAEKSFGKVGKNNEPWAIRLYDFCQARTLELTEFYQKIDTDAIGKVTREDFVDVIVNSEGPLTEEAVKKLVTIYDTSREGLIDYKDFLTGKKYLNKNYLHTAFEGKKKKKKGGKKGKGGKFKLPVPICTMPEGPRMDNGGPPEMFIPKYIHFTDRERFTRDNPPIHPLQDDSVWYLQMPEKEYVSINTAAKSGDILSIKKAVERGYSIDTRDKFFKTPLITACSHGNYDVAKFLIRNGADVNAVDNFMWTPLHHACHFGQLDVVKLLVEAGANVNCMALNKSTPIMRAIESSRIDIVKYLIDEVGCRIQTENRKGLNPVDISVQWADPRVYQCVREKWDSLPPPPDKKKSGRKTPAGKKKRPTTAPQDDQVKDKKSGEKDKQEGTVTIINESQTLPTVEKRGSILRAASALAGGLEETEDITWKPQVDRAPQKTTKELIDEKHQRHDRFGWEIDFPETYKAPFKKNVTIKAEKNAED